MIKTKSENTSRTGKAVLEGTRLGGLGYGRFINRKNLRCRATQENMGSLQDIGREEMSLPTALPRGPGQVSQGAK